MIFDLIVNGSVLLIFFGIGYRLGQKDPRSQQFHIVQKFKDRE